MSVEDAQLARPPRPGTVTTTVYLFYALAVLDVIGLALMVPYLGDMREIYVDAYKGTAQEEMGPMVGTLSVYLMPLLTLLLAVAYAVLGLLVGRGKNPARIVSWVFLGLILCCVGGGLALTSVAESMTSNAGGTGGPDPQVLADRLAAQLPDWVEVFGTVSNVVTVLGALVIIILLALPPSNAYFRKPEPVWVPPAGPMV